MSQVIGNSEIVQFQSVITANPPVWETREEYAVYCEWNTARNQYVNVFSRSLESGADTLTAAKVVFNLAKNTNDLEAAQIIAQYGRSLK